MGGGIGPVAVAAGMGLGGAGLASGMAVAAALVPAGARPDPTDQRFAVLAALLLGLAAAAGAVVGSVLAPEVAADR